ncbi:uncharacterized protein [Periplaneta americana]|uniref:uncharacterized protein isoform X3 n=1 Tax=Periplaneta americana TaxID=6978 RepID=UPI0037E90EBD
MHGSNNASFRHGVQQKRETEEIRVSHASKSAKPLLRLSQVLGLAPVTWPHFRPSTYGAVYSCMIFVAMLAWYFYTSGLSFMHEYPGKAITYIVPDMFNSAAIYVTSVTSLGLFASVSRRRPEVIMRLLAQVDEIVLAGSPGSAGSRGRAVVIGEIVAVLCLQTILALCDNLVWTGRLWNFHDYTLRYLAHLVNTTVILQFVNLALLLKQRFKKLNQLLQAFSPTTHEAWTTKSNLDSECNFQKIGNTYAVDDMILKPSLTSVDAIFGASTLTSIPSTTSAGLLSVTVHPLKMDDTSTKQDHLIFTLRKAHSMLCEVASVVNDMYGIQILLVITSAFIGSVWVLYLVLVATIGGNAAGKKQDYVALNICWLSYRCLKIFCVACACHVAQMEAKRTGVLVHRVLLQEEFRQGTGRCRDRRY